MTPGDELPEPHRERWDVDAMWSRVRVRTLDAPSGARRPFPWKRALATAASLIVIAGSAALIVRARLAPSASLSSEGRYSTSRGQYATIKLTDGSEVTLAPESRLTISARFSQGAREITLEGEAIFTVHHDATHPFKVSAGAAIIEDVGTRFDLRAYDADSSVTVAVVEGAVSLSAKTSASSPRAAGAIMVSAGDVGAVDKGGVASIDTAARAAGYLGWANGTLSFVDRPLSEVLRAIARWHDVDVRVPDARLARRRVTAEFSRQSAAAMIDALAVTLDATVERNAGIITLRPR
jgi:transmembrane sensor